ncbi:MAG: hypothetical protein ACK5CE_09290 [Actinomycetes bacterium]|jgi:hypothetical protein
MKIRTTIAVLALLSGATYLGAIEAQPVNATFWCAPSKLCVTQDANFSGLVDEQNQYNNLNWWGKVTFNNDGTWGNGNSSNARVYDYYNFSTNQYMFRTKCIGPGTTINGGANQNKGGASNWSSTPC